MKKAFTLLFVVSAAISLITALVTSTYAGDLKAFTGLATATQPYTNAVPVGVQGRSLRSVVVVFTNAVYGSLYIQHIRGTYTVTLLSVVMSNAQSVVLYVPSDLMQIQGDALVVNTAGTTNSAAVFVTVDQLQ